MTGYAVPSGGSKPPPYVYQMYVILSDRREPKDP
jgi:hypothetical protein